MDPYSLTNKKKLKPSETKLNDFIIYKILVFFLLKLNYILLAFIQIKVYYCEEWDTKELKVNLNYISAVFL